MSPQKDYEQLFTVFILVWVIWSLQFMAARCFTRTGWTLGTHAIMLTGARLTGFGILDLGDRVEGLEFRR